MKLGRNTERKYSMQVMSATTTKHNNNNNNNNKMEIQICKRVYAGS